MSDKAGNQEQEKVLVGWYTTAAVIGLLGTCFLAIGDDPVGLTICGVAVALVCFRKWAGHGIDNK